MKVADADPPPAILITIAACSLIRVHLPRCRAVLSWRINAATTTTTTDRLFVPRGLRFAASFVLQTSEHPLARRTVGYLAPTRHRSSAAEENSRSIWMLVVVVVVAIVKHLRACITRLPLFTPCPLVLSIIHS